MAPQTPRNPFVSPRFGQIATFMLLPAVETPAGLDVALLGIPYDGGTSYRSGARFGPRAVREQSSLIRPWNPVLKVHPFERLKVADCGDVDVVPISIERTHAQIEAKIDQVVAAGARPLSVGGDHSITLPILRALAKRHGPLAVVHFDAHPDTWDEYFGSKLFHGTPFRRAVEENLLDPSASSRSASAGRSTAPRTSSSTIGTGSRCCASSRSRSRGWRGPPPSSRGSGACRSTFRSTSTRATRPTRRPPARRGRRADVVEALSLVRSLAGSTLVGADVVEVSPPYDGPGQITALLAANLAFELLGVLALER
jgi:arginase family enzyme